MSPGQFHEDDASVTHSAPPAPRGPAAQPAMHAAESLPVRMPVRSHVALRSFACSPLPSPAGYAWYVKPATADDTLRMIASVSALQQSSVEGANSGGAPLAAPAHTSPMMAASARTSATFVAASRCPASSLPSSKPKSALAPPTAPSSRSRCSKPRTFDVSHGGYAGGAPHQSPHDGQPGFVVLQSRPYSSERSNSRLRFARAMKSVRPYSCTIEMFRGSEGQKPPRDGGAHADAGGAEDDGGAGAPSTT